jgi:hypothetical protein
VSDAQTPTADPEWLTYEQAAEQLGTSVQAVRQILRDGGLLTGIVDGTRRIPAALIVNGEISKYLRGVINLLRDGGYDDADALDWLLRYDESLRGTPAWALHHNLHREVSRRAQAMAF